MVDTVVGKGVDVNTGAPVDAGVVDTPLLRVGNNDVAAVIMSDVGTPFTGDVPMLLAIPLGTPALELGDALVLDSAVGVVPEPVVGSTMLLGNKLLLLMPYPVVV